jgi:peptidoglycan-associated lipoprotein
VKPSEAAKLEQVLAGLKSRGTGYDLLIEGHCDERGTEEYNRSLGERRALALRELMMNSGLSGQRVFTLTFGKDRPAALGHDEESMSKNRRGEFILVLPKKIITTQNTQ